MERARNAAARPALPVFIIGSFLFAGCFPRLRGTIGTAILAVPLAAVEILWRPPWWWSLAAAAAVVALATPLAAAAQRGAGKDPPWFLLDELAGMLITFTGLTHLTGASPILTACIAFFFFRGFDAVKPPPIRELERALHGAWGVMLDDVLAAIYAWPLSWAALSLLVALARGAA